MTELDERIKNLEFLVIKSRDLLQEQLKSFESCNAKAGFLISISSLFIPISITFLTQNDFDCWAKTICVISIIVSFSGIFFLLKVTLPKGLDHGFNFNQFENQANKTFKELLIYEISANKSSYIDNEVIVKKQNNDLKNGLKLIFLSIFLLMVSGINILTKEDTKTKTNIESLEINHLKINKMEENKTNNTTNSTSSNSSQSTSESSSITFSTVPSNERANIQKGENTQPLTTKEEKE
ncbi:hypothetical protein ABTW24_05580 [Sphingobacterium thalpophilum]|uniref:Pycsar effector protein domain-containing protein n=1 Tax=Sphingobacterium thalpophilum TaxID=259 RepID=A0ABV4H9B9_9SPHI